MVFSLHHLSRLCQCIPCVNPKYVCDLFTAKLCSRLSQPDLVHSCSHSSTWDHVGSSYCKMAWQICLRALYAGNAAAAPVAAQPAEAAAMTPQELAKRCGLVFQFPERYFLGGTLQEVGVRAWCSTSVKHAVSVMLSNIHSSEYTYCSCCMVHLTGTSAVSACKHVCMHCIT